MKENLVWQDSEIPAARLWLRRPTPLSGKPAQATRAPEKGSWWWWGGWWTTISEDGSGDVVLQNFHNNIRFMSCITSFIGREAAAAFASSWNLGIIFLFPSFQFSSNALFFLQNWNLHQSCLKQRRDMMVRPAQSHHLFQYWREWGQRRKRFWEKQKPSPFLLAVSSPLRVWKWIVSTVKPSWTRNHIKCKASRPAISTTHKDSRFLSFSFRSNIVFVIARSPLGKEH